MVYRYYARMKLKTWEEKTTWANINNVYYRRIEIGKYVGELDKWTYYPNFECYVCYSLREAPPLLEVPTPSVVVP